MKAVAKLKVVPEAPFDAIAEAVAEVDKRHGAVVTLREALNVARIDEHKRRERFDGGDQAVTVEELAHCRELRESWERRHTAAEDAEQAARVVLAQEEARRAKGEYGSRIAHAGSWRSRMGGLLARFAAIDLELGKVVEEVADVIADASIAFDGAVALENVVRPLVSLGAQGERAATIADARELVRIHVARQREKAGRDALADGWLNGLTRPDWKDVGRANFDASVAALTEMEETK